MNLRHIQSTRNPIQAFHEPAEDAVSMDFELHVAFVCALLPSLLAVLQLCHLRRLTVRTIDHCWLLSKT